MINLEGTIPPSNLWKRVWDILYEIYDESGEENLGEGYLLKYEGWGGICVEEIWEEVEAEQKRRGIDIYCEEAEGEREESCYEYAREQSFNIIGDEWKPELNKRGYRFIDGGYDGGGIYGITRALFKIDV